MWGCGSAGFLLVSGEKSRALASSWYTEGANFVYTKVSITQKQKGFVPMDTIASFQVNHLTLEPGVYVSRRDQDPATGAVVTTFDLRMCAPNREPVMNTAELHTIEHLGATYLRNDAEWASRVVYFGPMGCRTGCYLVVFGQVESAEIAPLVTRMFEWIAQFEGDIPGAAPEACGNYLDQNLGMARWLAKRYLEHTLRNISEAHLVYPA